MHTPMPSAWQAAAALYAVLTLSLPSAVSAGKSKSKTTSFCGDYDAVNSTSLRYTLLADEWGDDGSGQQCMTVDLGSGSDAATSFNATWAWSGNRTEVHSFPSVILNSALFPLNITNLTSLTLNATWSIYADDELTAETDGTSLAAIDTVADVALDMFLDADGDKAGDASDASTEVMIWQAAYGNLKPLGWDTVSSDPPVVEVAGVNYTLYQGNNGSPGQTVFSWVPATNLSAINTDLVPLMSYLVDGGYLSNDMYMGRMQFGSETMHSSTNITFMVNSLTMNINEETWTAPKGSGSGGGDDDDSAAPGGLRPSLALALLAGAAVFFVRL